jgi:hypothetical protein
VGLAVRALGRPAGLPRGTVRRVRQGGALLPALRESTAVLALAFPPWSGEDDEADEHWVGLVAGIPVVAWCRDGRYPAQFAREVKELMAADLMKLPRRTMELRRQALSSGSEGTGSGHLGLHLTLVFDDADRIPEPYVRLRPPA